MYLVAFSATNMHIYYKVAIRHLMQAWVSFTSVLFSGVSMTVPHTDWMYYAYRMYISRYASNTIYHIA